MLAELRTFHACIRECALTHRTDHGEAGLPRMRDVRSLRLVLLRSRDLALLADTVARTVSSAWDLVSMSEFSVLYRQVRPYTMCSNRRLRALHRGVSYVVSNNVQGAVVECGCARGGSAALLGLALQQLGAERSLWLFDTFEGLPAPTTGDPDYEFADLYTGTCVGTLEDVQQLFRGLGLTRNVHFIKGLFQDTLPDAPTGAIALLHIDGDWYESVKACLNNFYDRLTPGGIIQFDDFGFWQGARKAIEEFMNSRGIDVPLQPVDYSGRVLIKP